MPENKVLLVVDIQNDFCPGGALGIDAGDKIIPKVNRYIELFRSAGLPVLISRDWHPPKTRHFKEYGGLWPAHCVQNTPGAAFHPALRLPENVIILSKGINENLEGYSVYQAQDERGRPFTDVLRSFNVKELYIAGLATDYCVRATTLDALREGLRVKVLIDAVKGVDLKPDDSRKAVDEIRARGAQTVTFDEVKTEL